MQAPDVAPQTRRVSRPITEDPESGWEDNNIFQSGGESSPMRPSPVRPKARKSLAARPAPKSRKSMSAPPEMLSSPSPPKNKGKERERLSSVKPPESKFEPDLPAEVYKQREVPAHQSPFRQRLFARELSIVSDVKEVEEPPSQEEPPVAAFDEADHSPAHDEAVQSEDGEAYSDKEHDLDDENVVAVSQRIADGGAIAKYDVADEAPRRHWFLRFIFALFVLSTTPVIYQYKQESSSIGFCDTGSSTNPVLDGLRAHRAAVYSCNVENRTTLWPHPGPDGTTSVLSPIPTASATGVSGNSQLSATTESAVACPAPPLVPFAQPDECAPCPKHATCTPNSVTCENGYILRPHPLLAVFPVPYTNKEAHSALQTFERPSNFAAASDVSRIVYSALSYALDGLPYLGPVAVPPRCVEDPRRKRHIGVLGKAIESILANERGRRLCEGVGVGVPEGDDAAEAQRWGIEVEKLRENIKEKTAVSH